VTHRDPVRNSHVVRRGVSAARALALTGCVLSGAFRAASADAPPFPPTEPAARASGTRERTRRTPPSLETIFASLIFPSLASFNSGNSFSTKFLKKSAFLARTNLKTQFCK
jgi:hypothetical protein